jgi:hypothetical protein
MQFKSDKFLKSIVTDHETIDYAMNVRYPKPDIIGQIDIVLVVMSWTLMYARVLIIKLRLL